MSDDIIVERFGPRSLLDVYRLRLGLIGVNIEMRRQMHPETQAVEEGTGT
ncbi:hypothetical protein [Bradyrhizobium japonicum]|nr:hypothetical protein [Bradyrhizobium japonicum]